MSRELLQLQADITAKLNAEASFATINVISVRKLQIQSEIDQSLVHLTAKAGKLGVGVLVGMPTVIVDKPNPQGPVLTVAFGIRVVESPVINMDAGQGTLMPAEDVAIQTLLTIHEFEIEGLCLQYADQNAIQPNTELEGLVAYDVLFKATLAIAALTKTALPAIESQGAGLFDFIGIPAGASVYWTSDGSFPDSTKNLYAGGNVAQAGTIRWAAWKANQIGSNVGQAVIA